MGERRGKGIEFAVRRDETPIICIALPASISPPGSEVHVHESAPAFPINSKMIRDASFSSNFDISPSFRIPRLFISSRSAKSILLPPRISFTATLACPCRAMSLPSFNPEKSAAGIVVDPGTLERVVPSSKRKDGT